MVNEKMAKAIVEGIEQGIKMGRLFKIDNTDRFYNSEGFNVVDKIMSSLYFKLKEYGNLEVFGFHRYHYEVLLAYDRDNHTLYSFISDKRLHDLINSKKIKDKQNYIFSLMKFNSCERIQQTLFPESEELNNKSKIIQEKIKEIIMEDKNIQYITIIYNQKNYKLLNVVAKKFSQYAECVETQDLSDYISVDYEEIYESQSEAIEEFPSELEFNIKPEILAKSGELEIKEKIEKNDKESEKNE